MMKSRTLLCLLVLLAAIAGPGAAVAADEPSTSASVPATTDTSTDTSADTSTDTAPLTLDQDQIQALTDQANGTEEDKSAFEKASDFVTDNAPWFIIGIIVLSAIIAGILIMRGRPRKSGAPGTPQASKSNKAMRNAGGVASKDAPAQVPSASELRRRKRAAIQRSREEERMRRKSGMDERKAVRRGGAPAAPVAAPAAGATAVTAAGVAAGGLDPVEAEKQGARDQETAAAAVARFGGVAGLVAPSPPQTRPVPAPVSPSQTAPAAGIVTPDLAPPVAPAPSAEPAFEATQAPETTFESAPAPEAAPMPEAETSIIHEPSIENPGPDAVVGNAAESFLAGAAAGAAGGLAAARANQPDPAPAGPEEPLEPVIAPEPGMAPEHALADLEPLPQPPAPDVADETAAAAAEERLRAKVAEIKATQEPAAPPPEPVVEAQPEPELPAPAVELSPGLAAVERKLSENSEERERALAEAEERLRRVEQRAEDAERRAAFAERLAQLKIEESDRERRLNDVVTGIVRAESRAGEAEARAEAAERAAAAALGQSDLKAPEPHLPPAPPAPVVEAKPESPAPPAPPQADASSDDPPLPERRGLFGGSTPTPSPDSDAVNLNSATFEELREAGLSVTQATRILAYRERFGGYSSVEDLEKVPGFPADLIENLRGRLSI